MNRKAAMALGLAILAAAMAGCGPRTADGLRERGARAYRAGRYGSAARDLDRAARLEPGHADGRLWQGLALWRAGSHDAALQALFEAATLRPADPAPLEFAARVLGEQGRWREARIALNQALQRGGLNSPRLLNAMGVASAMGGQPEAARSQFEACGAYPPALFNLGVLNRDAFGDWPRAKTCFESYLKAAPDGDRANAARQALDVDGAARPRTADRAVAPRDPERAADLVRQARAAAQRRDYEEAAVRYREAAEAGPDRPDPVWDLAQLYENRLQQPAKAIEIYRVFLRDFPDDSRAADARRRLNDLSARAPVRRVSPETPPPGALQAGELTFRKPERRRPAEAQAALARGTQYLSQRDWDRALFDYKRAIELDDSLLEAYFNMGLAYWNQRKFEQARQLFQIALANRPDWAEAQYMLADVYIREGVWIKAEEHLLALVKANPDFEEAYAALAGHHAGSASRRAQVREWFERYLRLAPRGRHAATARAWLAANP